MKTGSPISDAFSIKEFAQAYGVSPSTVSREIAKKRLRSQVNEGRRYIDSLEAERWLAAHGHIGRVVNLRPIERRSELVSRASDWSRCRRLYQDGR